MLSPDHDGQVLVLKRRKCPLLFSDFVLFFEMLYFYIMFFKIISYVYIYNLGGGVWV